MKCFRQNRPENQPENTPKPSKKHFFRAMVRNRPRLGAIMVLLLSAILAFLQSCLNYPARLGFGVGVAAPYSPQNTLISSQFVMELSPAELENLGVPIVRESVQVYRITYRSQNFSPLSALILLPANRREYHLLAYHHATLFPFPYKNLGAYEAPSFFGSRYRKAKDFASVIHYGLPAASSGYLTVMPDYMGYGVQAGREHPFMIGPELGQESIDAVRAAYEWAGQQGLATSKRLYLAGLSEGAYAAMWAHRFVEEAADFEDIQVEGAYYAGPYHTSSLMQKLVFDDADIKPLFNWALYANWHYYLRNAEKRKQILSRYFREEQYRQLLQKPRSWQKQDIWRKKVPNILTILLAKPSSKESLFQNSFLEQLNDLDSDFWVLARLLNIHNGWRPRGAIYLYHNQQDPLIPLSNSLDAQKEFATAGAAVTLQIFERDDHSGARENYLRSSLKNFGRSSGL